MRLQTMAAVGFALLCACGEPFLNPVVTCPERTILFMVTNAATRVDRPCSYGDFTFSVGYAPMVDRLADPMAMNTSLPRGKVTVTGGQAGVLLCPGAGQLKCTGGLPEITVTISDQGVLSYQGIASTDGVSVLGGGQLRTNGVLLYESFGPGNTCLVNANYDFNCLAPEM